MEMILYRHDREEILGALGYILNAITGINFIQNMDTSHSSDTRNCNRLPHPLARPTCHQLGSWCRCPVRLKTRVYITSEPKLYATRIKFRDKLNDVEKA